MTSSGKSSQSFTSPLEVQSPALPAVVEAEDGGHQVERDVQRHYLQVQRYSGGGGGGGGQAGAHLAGHGVAGGLPVYWGSSLVEVSQPTEG